MLPSVGVYVRKERIPCETWWSVFCCNLPEFLQRNTDCSAYPDCRDSAITLKPIDGVVPLPKFEDYINASDTSKLERLQPRIEEYTVKWQEKVLSPWEIHQYGDRHNCATEQQLKYHEIIQNGSNDRNRVFTYVHEDNYVTEGVTTNGAFLDDIGSVGMLGTCFERLNMTDPQEEMMVLEPTLKSLGRKSVCKIEMQNEEWTNMHIMMDGSEQDGDIEVIMNREALLLSLYYNTRTECLVLRPDINSLEWNPYVVEAGGRRWNYHYAVNICRDPSDHLTLEAKNELVILLKKMQRKWERKHRHLLHFTHPPHSTTRYYITVEILRASDFEDDHLFIEYEVKIPPTSKCEERLDGRTHTARKQGSVANYSHAFDLELDYVDSATDEVGEGDVGTPLLYVEVISELWWGLERTQGAALCRLPLHPGKRCVRALCVRPEDSTADQSRRFFLGGARLLDDTSWLGIPRGHKGRVVNKLGMKTVTAGVVDLRVTVVSQAERCGVQASGDACAASTSAGALFRSVDAVLHQYKHARQRLIACKRRLRIDDTTA